MEDGDPEQRALACFHAGNLVLERALGVPDAVRRKRALQEAMRLYMLGNSLEPRYREHRFGMAQAHSAMTNVREAEWWLRSMMEHPLWPTRQWCETWMYDDAVVLKAIEKMKAAQEIV
jgi:hypothetical protein